MLLTQYRIVAEIPINARDAKRRCLPITLAKLLIEPIGADIVALAELIMNWREGDGCIYASPINPYNETSTMEKANAQGDIKCISTGQSLFCVTTQQGMLSLLAANVAEACVFVLCGDGDEIVNAMCQASDAEVLTNQYETRYMRFMHLFHACLFYSASHHSLEILGEPEYICTRFLKTLII